MKHPVVLIVPIMMLADYFLTVLGAIEREKGYGRHFRLEHYELNPLWQKSISAKKWFNPRHLLLVVAFAFFLVWISQSQEMPEGWMQGFLGALLAMFGAILGRHVSNILIFRRVANKSHEVSGQVTMSHQYALAISMYQLSIVMIPMALIAIFSGDDLARGAAAGIALLLLAHWRWSRKARRRIAAPKPA